MRKAKSSTSRPAVKSGQSKQRKLRQKKMRGGRGPETSIERRDVPGHVGDGEDIPGEHSDEVFEEWNGTDRHQDPVEG